MSNTKRTSSKAGTSTKATRKATPRPRKGKGEQEFERMFTPDAEPVVTARDAIERDEAEFVDQFVVADRLGVPVQEVSPVTEAIGLTPEQSKPTKQPKPMPTLEEALATAKRENPIRFDDHVLAVTELAKDGSPKRVLIECTDPQTKQGANGEQVSVCEGTREIATQDLFQVSCCAACADRKVRKARRNRAKTRAKEARKALAARKATL